jgi:hypothetical protein
MEMDEPLKWWVNKPVIVRKDGGPFPPAYGLLKPQRSGMYLVSSPGGSHVYTFFPSDVESITTAGIVTLKP